MGILLSLFQPRRVASVQTQTRWTRCDYADLTDDVLIAEDRVLVQLPIDPMGSAYHIHQIRNLDPYIRLWHLFFRGLHFHYGYRSVMPTICTEVFGVIDIRFRPLRQDDEFDGIRQRVSEIDPVPNAIEQSSSENELSLDESPRID